MPLGMEVGLGSCNTVLDVSAHITHIVVVCTILIVVLAAVYPLRPL